MNKEKENNPNSSKKNLWLTGEFEKMWDEHHSPEAREKRKYLQAREERAKMIRINAGI